MTREEAIEDLQLALSTGNYIFTKSRESLRMAISALSENKGEWVEVVEERFPNGEKQVWHYECSACGTGEPITPINKEHWDFCPNCGVDMRAESYDPNDLTHIFDGVTEIPKDAFKGWTTDELLEKIRAESEGK